MNKYIDKIISQNTTQFYAQYVQYISQRCNKIKPGL